MTMLINSFFHNAFIFHLSPIIMQSIKLPNGEIPILGLGTWQLQGRKCKEAVLDAIKLGYRHIDTAWVYDNQEEIGQAIKESKVAREKIFITSKVWRDNLHYLDVLEQCQETLEQLQLEYLDLYLIHWPDAHIPMRETFKALHELQQQGKIRNIGVSNFTIQHLEEAKKHSRKIAVNQVEYHPYLNQQELLEYCHKQKIKVTAYSPLGRGKILHDKTLTTIAHAHQKSSAQVCLRWLLQKGMVVIPKASSEHHLKTNMEIFDFSLTEKETQLINTIAANERLVNPGFAEFD